MADFSKIRVGESRVVFTTAFNQEGAIGLEFAQSWKAQNEPLLQTNTVGAPSITTALANTMIILLAFITDDVTVGVFSGTGSPTERLDVNTALGLDATIAADTFTLAAAGATGARTASIAGSAFSVGAALALQSASGSPVFGNTGTSAAVASGNLTPSEPAAANPDDIMICVLEQRDNVVSTMSADWTRVFAVDHIKRTGEESRASVWWHRRGGSAPSYLITRAGGNAAIAAVMSFGGIVDTGSPIHRVAVSSQISVLQLGDLNDQVATLVGQFPGATDAVVYAWGDAISGTGTTTQPVTVIDASTIGFNVSELVFDGTDGQAIDTPVPVTAIGLDVGEGTPSPAYTLTDVTWSIAGGATVIDFDGGINTGPTVSFLAVARGSDIINVTAKNATGQTITGQLVAKVLTVATVTLGIETDEDPEA